MPGLITCPKCNYQFQPTDAFRQEVQRELNNKAKEWQTKKEEEYRQNVLVKRMAFMSALCGSEKSCFRIAHKHFKSLRINKKPGKQRR